MRETRNFLGRDEECLTFDLEHAFPDGEILTSRSVLRFADRVAIEAAFAAEGLTSEAVFGNWDGSPFDPATSPEMIFHMRHA